MHVHLCVFIYMNKFKLFHTVYFMLSGCINTYLAYNWYDLIPATKKSQIGNIYIVSIIQAFGILYFIIGIYGMENMILSVKISILANGLGSLVFLNHLKMDEFGWSLMTDLSKCVTFALFYRNYYYI